MIKKDLNADLLNKEVDPKYVFFVQLWHELLNIRTLDTYQYKLLNSYSALCELITVIDKTIAGIFISPHNILDCVAECAQIIKNDEILIISRLGKHQFATRKTVIRIKERTNSQRGTHQFARGTHLQMAT